MQKIVEANEIPILGNYDVIVAGGGPAGVGTAISAARHGMKVLVVERFGCLGGMWTAGLVNPLFDYENKGGIVQEIVDRINALAGKLGRIPGVTAKAVYTEQKQK